MSTHKKRPQNSQTDFSADGNGVGPDQDQNVDVTVEAGAPLPKVNASSYPRQPGGEDLFVSPDGGGAFNPIKEVASGSGLPTEYLVRTEVDGNEIMDLVDLLSQNQQMTLGYIDLPGELWTMLHLRRSIRGNTLKMVKEMYIGERARQFAMRAGMFSRASTITKEQFTPEPK